MWLSAILNRRKWLLIITGRSGFGGILEEGRREEFSEGSKAWLDRQPLYDNTRRAYRIRAGQYLEYLAATPTEYGDSQEVPHARDFKARLKTVRRALKAASAARSRENPRLPTPDSLLPGAERIEATCS